MKAPQKDLKEWLNKLKPLITKVKAFTITNIRYIIVAILFIALVVLLVKCTSDEKKETDKVTQEDQTLSATDEEATEAESLGESEVSDEIAEEVAEVPNDLQVDMYPEVNTLINLYYTAISSSDTATLNQIVKSLSEDELNKLVQKREYIENYQNIVCYTKNGPVENSYLVFPFYEIKFVNINTLVPGIEILYVNQDEAGNLYIYNGDMDEETMSYIESVLSHEDVVALYNTTDAKYQEAQTADPDLKAFVEQLKAVAEQNVQGEESTVAEDTVPADESNEVNPATEGAAETE